jgi:formylglycine-generating enzyme required for sulfatase activity
MTRRNVVLVTFPCHRVVSAESFDRFDVTGCIARWLFGERQRDDEGRSAPDPPTQSGVEAPQAITAIHAEDRLGELITIPAGRFLMGNNGHEGFENAEEFPQHQVDLPAFQIGKCEVTRGQFRKFLNAGGYEDSRYWSAEGWAWKQSDAIDYSGMNGSVTHTQRPNATQSRREPEHWAPEQEWIGHGHDHRRFTQTDNHPVVGVTYYEAEAYCKWAGGRLSTEAEWEKAARWDETHQHANTWPWGDQWDPEKCNNADDHNAAGGGFRVNQSAPVGSYPQGASPYGCLDMVGNAWEWVTDSSKSYPGNPAPFDRTLKFFSVKGGCWDDGPSGVRCSYRGWYLPPSSSGTGPGDSDYIGFRVAR